MMDQPGRYVQLFSGVEIKVSMGVHRRQKRRKKIAQPNSVTKKAKIASPPAGQIERTLSTEGRRSAEMLSDLTLSPSLTSSIVQTATESTEGRRSAEMLSDLTLSTSSTSSKTPEGNSGRQAETLLWPLMYH